jgi:plasmid stabilization system protein ParE
MRVGTAPIAYALVPRYESIGIRRRIHGNYIIFYKIHQAQVFVLRILHGARDYGYLLERIANPRPSSAPR